jgi:hypothetical protein
MSSLWTQFLEPWVSCDQYCTTAGARGPQQSFSSVLLVALNEKLEKKLLRSLPCCVACDGCCEPRCSRSERVCVPLCLRCGMFALHSVPLCEKVDVRHNHNTNGRCQRYCREHHARLALALPCRRALPLPFTSRAGAAPRSLQARGLQFSASFRLGLCFPRLSLATTTSTTPSLPAMAHSSPCRSHLQVHPRTTSPRRLATMGQCFCRLLRRNTADSSSPCTQPAVRMPRRNNLRHQQEIRRHHPPTPSASRGHHGVALAPESRSSMATASVAATAASKAVVSGRDLQHLPSSWSTTLTSTTSVPTSRPLSMAAARGASSPPTATPYQPVASNKYVPAPVPQGANCGIPLGAKGSSVTITRAQTAASDAGRHWVLIFLTICSHLSAGRCLDVPSGRAPFFYKRESACAMILAPTARADRPFGEHRVQHSIGGVRKPPL